jgi:hypothetical protein
VVRFRAILFTTLVAVASCDTPHPLSDYAGVEPERIAVHGSEFSVRVAGDAAQAVRTDFDMRAWRGRDIVPRAGIAMEQVSGCRVLPGTLRGDASVIDARLDC